MTTRAKGLVAVGLCGFAAVLVKAWPGLDSEPDPQSTPWGAEIEAVGSSRADEMGLEHPTEAGLWVWEGTIVYRDPECPPVFHGTWRRPTGAEMEGLR